MNQTCEQVRDGMVPALRGELKPLEKARLESHVARCQPCARARRELDAGLQAACAWQPELDAAHAERLLGRLTPYLGSRQASLGWTWALVAAAAAVLVAAGVTAWWRLQPAPPAVAVVAPPAVVEPAIAHEGAPIQHQVSAAVRFLAPADWQGEVREQGLHTRISLGRGYVAVAFAGGKGRTVEVVRGKLRVAAMGTRFLVDAVADGGALVAVSEGRVRVSGPAGEWELSAGEARQIGADGSVRSVSSPRTALLADDFLSGPSAPRSPPRRRSPVVIDVAEQLERAELLSAARQFVAAETIYLACVEEPAADYEAYRDLCRMQLARLWGLTPGKRAAARAMAERLARGASGTMSREAALLVCELELKESACHAARCLARLSRSTDQALAVEAARLAERWQVHETRCE